MGEVPRYTLYILIKLKLFKYFVKKIKTIYFKKIFYLIFRNKASENFYEFDNATFECASAKKCPV